MQLLLVDKKQVAPDTISFFFRPDMPITWKPGQFMRYRIPQQNPDDRGENRFFSIASAPSEGGHIQLTTKFAPEKGSSFKAELQKLEVGKMIEGDGPKGSFSMDDPSRQYVFIAGGIGITPFRAILKELENSGQPINVNLLYANRTKEALFKKEFEELAKKHPEFKINYIVADEPVSDEKISENVRILPGKIDAPMVQNLVPNFAHSIFYISGPEPMVLAFEQMINSLGVPMENIKRDYFPGYEHF
jgi:glycine betaine catabolism B